MTPCGFKCNKIELADLSSFGDAVHPRNPWHPWHLWLQQACNSSSFFAVTKIWLVSWCLDGSSTNLIIESDHHTSYTGNQNILLGQFNRIMMAPTSCGLRAFSTFRYKNLKCCDKGIKILL